MLAILSEINCLEQLQMRGIYPDYFSTDFDAFKNYVVLCSDCTCVVILAGTNRFYKKHIIEMIKSFNKLVEDGNTLNKVIVLSDVNIPSLSKYYKVNGSLSHISEYSGWKLVEDNSDVLDTLKTSKVEANVVLSDYDRGIYKREKSKWVKRKSSEDDLIPLIKIPKLSIK